MDEVCPWCSAPRGTGVKCLKCGAIYAKAAALRAGHDPIPSDVAPVEPQPPIKLEPVDRANPEFAPKAPTVWQGNNDDDKLEFKMRLVAIPIAFLLALWFHSFSIGHFLQRTFFGMMVHEAGHAVSAWFCGYFAVPTLWKTFIADDRGFLTPLVFFGLHGYLLLRAIHKRLYGLVVLASVLLCLQLVGTFILSKKSAETLICFGGDGGAIVLGTVLMATFFFGRQTQIYQGWLRWGFLVIGSAAFVDSFATWVEARHNYDAIPFGEIEGVGLSDPSKLTDLYGWSTRAMVGRYVWLGIVCLVGLTVVWLWGIRWAWRRLPQHS